MNNANLYALLESGFSADRNKVAIETPERNYSWSDIERMSAQYAMCLQMLDLPAGSRVAVQVEKSPEALMLYLGTIRAGLVYLPLNVAYRTEEIAYFLKDAEPAVLVCSSKNLAWAAPLAADAGTLHVYTMDEDGGGTLSQASACQGHVNFKTVQSAADDLAAILYTSGTTGRSKGAMLSHRNLSSNAQVLNDYWGWRSEDVLLHMLPIFHVHGLFVAAHGALLAGARMIWLPRFDVKQALHYLQQCTVMMGVPTYYVRLLGDSSFTRDACKNIRLFVSGSAPLLAATFTEFQARTGHTILERYGMSETVMLTSNPYDESLGMRIGGTVGQPLPGVSVRVVDDNDQSMQPGETGNVQVRGPNVFSGYWRMPEKTREEFTADGWFRTGDVGRWGEVVQEPEAITQNALQSGLKPLDEPRAPASYLSIVGRSKDLIISGGFNIYPKEIEAVIDGIPGIAESAVVGVAHQDFGEAVVAIVVPQAGVSVDAAELRAKLKSRIANFKVPKHIHIVDELPRNAMGKVQKNVLRETYKKG